MALTLGRNTPLERVIFQNFSLSLDAGEFVVIIGNNGAGKSTLLNVISGFQPVDCGAVLIDKQNISNMSAAVRSACVAHVMQDPKAGTMANMTLEENLSFAYMRGKQRTYHLHNTHQRRTLFKEALSVLNINLENRLNDNVASLSGGQRQSLALIMASLTDSKILLLDEITAALDPAAAETVMNFAAMMIDNEKKTAIMITHNMQHALRFGDRTLIIHQGKIVQNITRAERSALTVMDLMKLSNL